jgi:hypothetical protein
MSMAEAITKSYQLWERKPADLYPTPVDATESIMPLINSLIDNGLMPGKRVWEPACGDGRLARVLEWHGLEVTSSDLREFPGYGTGGIDFLSPHTADMIGMSTEPFDAVITNPPFSHSVEFLIEARSYAPVVIFLLKQNYWNTKGRLDLWDGHRPTFFLPITWRLAFLEDERGSSPLMDCAWCVWVKGMSEECFFEPVRKLVYPGESRKGVFAAMAGLTEAMDEFAGLLETMRGG